MDTDADTDIVPKRGNARSLESTSNVRGIGLDCKDAADYDGSKGHKIFRVANGLSQSHRVVLQDPLPGGVRSPLETVTAS